MTATAKSGTSILLNKYIACSMETVRGFLKPLDAQLISTLLSYQDENNITGHLCEIGVHHGRLFLMLALARRAGRGRWPLIYSRTTR